MKRAAILGLALLAACKTDARDDADTGAPSTTPAPASERERRRLHQDAFAALVPLAAEAMKLADPLAAAELGLAPPAPLPTALGDKEALRTATEKARLEAAEIDESLLEPKQRIGLRTMRFVLARIHDQLARHPPVRNDPTLIPGACARVLDELDYRSASGDCSECAQGLESLIPALHALPAELTASSAAGLDASLADLDALRARVEAFPPRTTEADALTPIAARVVAEIDESKAALERVRSQLADAPVHTWESRPPPRGGASGAARLPDRLGARALIRRLEVEESLAIEPVTLMAAAKRNLARFSAMRTELAGDARAQDQPRPVDATRCEAAWATLTRATLSQPGFEDASIDCAALARQLGDERLDDADLLLRVVDTGAIEPVRRAFRRGQDPTIALATGAWTADAQRILRRIMILGPTQDRVAIGRAIDAGTSALCAASASLWVHAELGEDAILSDWLREACPAQPPEQWIARALAHPRRSLMGLGVASVSAEPASMVGIDMFYWAPLGLVPLLATPPDALPSPERPDDPALAQPGPPPGFQVEVEELD